MVCRELLGEIRFEKNARNKEGRGWGLRRTLGVAPIFPRSMHSEVLEVFHRVWGELIRSLPRKHLKCVKMFLSGA
jgi:hypothetical protein